MDYRELSNEQRRQWLDFMQIDARFNELSLEMNRKYTGSMRWLPRGGNEYLHVKRRLTEKSLGPRSKETEAIYSDFLEGRQNLKEEIKVLQDRLQQMAPVNRALGLGRVPKPTAQILRLLEKENLLGTHLLVAGTNSLWAYEAKAGLHFQSGIVSTQDADMIWDARLGIELVPLVSRKEGIISLLKRIDPSFKTRGAHDYRAFNNSGFAVDLIRPEDRLFFSKKREQLTEAENDIKSAPLQGLQWLLNVPRFQVRAMAEDGLAVTVSTFDPRAFALHKLWVSKRPDREPLKVQRDIAQAKIVAKVARTFLNLKFEAEDLQGLPNELRVMIPNLD